MKLQIKVHRKILLAIICIAIMTFASGVFYAIAQSSPLNVVTINAGAYPDAPSYTIYAAGQGNYYAKDAYGSVDFTSTNAANVINSVFNALPNNPTSQQIVKFEGNFVLSRTIDVPNDTVIDLSDAYISLANGVNGDIFYMNNAHCVDLIKGTINGNGANQNAGSGIDFFRHSHDCSVIGTKMLNIWGDCVLLNCYDYDIRVEDCNLSSSVQGSGIYELTGGNNNLFSGNCITNSAQNGIAISTTCWGDDVENNYVAHNSWAGIIVYSGCSKEIITNNRVMDNIKEGIILNSNVASCTVSDNLCEDNDYNNQNFYAGLVCTSASSYNTFEGNVADTTTGTSRQTYGVNINTADCLSNTIIDNVLYNNKDGAIRDNGTSTRIYSNAGYNALGKLANCWVNQSLSYLVDSGGNITFNSGYTYNNEGSPKIAYISGDTVSSIIVDVVTLYTSAGNHG